MNTPCGTSTTKAWDTRSLTAGFVSRALLCKSIALRRPRRTSAFCEEREEEGVWHGSFFPELLGGLAQGHGPVLMWHANLAKERNCRRPGSSETLLCSSRNAARPRCEQDKQVQWYRPWHRGGIFESDHKS
ncbi:hypothetical protein CY35_12G108800 [Sphagnum magellanicum]|nr:hypothetical protein CY35_12G108800 [Sphagnum magellanicum]